MQSLGFDREFAAESRAVRAALLALLVMALEAHAWTRGQEVFANLHVCLKKEDAIEVAKADESGGVEAARKLWAEKDGCDTVPVMGMQIGATVHTSPIKREGGFFTMYVIELVNPAGKVEGYFFSTTPVTAKLDVVPKRGGNA